MIQCPNINMGEFFKHECHIFGRTAQPPLTRLMSPMSEVAISILCQDRSDSVRSQFDIPKALKANVKVAHLNVWSLKSRENFCLVKDTILHNGFDIFTVFET